MLRAHSTSRRVVRTAGIRSSSRKRDNAKLPEWLLAEAPQRNIRLSSRARSGFSQPGHAADLRIGARRSCKPLQRCKHKRRSGSGCGVGATGLRRLWCAGPKSEAHPPPAAPFQRRSRVRSHLRNSWNSRSRSAVVARLPGDTPRTLRNCSKRSRVATCTSSEVAPVAPCCCCCSR
jgi:hypothetical protein